jgi:hypothetical protein
MLRNRRYALSVVPDRKIHAAFIEPMLLLRTDKLPEGPDVVYELFLLIGVLCRKFNQPHQHLYGATPDFWLLKG